MTNEQLLLEIERVIVNTMDEVKRKCEDRWNLDVPDVKLETEREMELHDTSVSGEECQTSMQLKSYAALDRLSVTINQWLEKRKELFALIEVAIERLEKNKSQKKKLDSEVVITGRS